MTIREAFESCLIEINKVLAPALLLDDFVYLFNKAVQKYFNKRYNLFETSQQLTDDLRVLLKTVKLNPQLINSNTVPKGYQNVFKSDYICDLPDDYVHILNCICEFRSTDEHCLTCSKVQVGASKLDTAEWPHSINNYYMRPSIRRPYYYISNIENPKPDAVGSPSKYGATTQRISGERYGNAMLPKMLIKCGGDLTKGILDSVYIDYLRAPKFINLTQAELDAPSDPTAELEFPDYVVYEIINELVTLMLENGKDQRVQTFASIAAPSVATPASKK